MMKYSDQHILFFFEEALKEASSVSSKDIPVGAILVYRNEIIARGKNSAYQDNNFILHAEINAIYDGLKKYPLLVHKSSLWVTMEPCICCMGAIVDQQIKEIHYLIKNPKYGASKIGIDHPFYKLSWPLSFDYSNQLITKHLIDNSIEKLKHFFI